MKKASAMRQLLPLVLFLAVALPSHSQLAVGKWRDHLSYSELLHVEAADDRIICSSADALFYYDLDDNTVNRLNKTTSLNDVGVNTFAYDPQTHYVMVAYSNANIDIIKDDKAYNINDIRRSNIAGSKRINSISFKNRKAFLACAFGIVVIDMNRDEISETIYLGSDGGMMNVNDVVFTDSLIVAATDSGIYTAPKDSPLLSLVTTWRRDNSSLLAGQRITHLAVSDDGRLLALVQDSGDTSLYRESGPLAFAPLLNGDIRSFRFAQQRIVVCRDRAIEVYDRNGTLQRSIGDVDWMDMQPNDATLDRNGTLWVAHNWASLVSVNAAGTESHSFSPGGPWSPNAYRVVAYDSTLFICPGGHSATYTGVYNVADIYSLHGSDWRTLDDPNGILRGKYDIVDVAVNPANGKQLMATVWGSGIVEINDNKVTAFYNDSNSDGALTRFSLNNYSALLNGGVAYDKEGNAWFTNSLTGAALAVRRSDGSWANFSTIGVVTSDIDRIIWDSINDTKLFWGRQNCIFAHDGANRFSYIDPNNGAKLQTSTVNCLVQDHSGQIWIGTNKGIKVIYNLANVFDNGGGGEKSPVTCNNILFNENGITEYLMAYESITSIVVDGANRKWVGTSTGGLYLLSANGLQELEHFTAAETPLFSDKIVSLAIMPWSGELFVVTDRGVQSYRTTATYAFINPMDDIHAFPNPVRPGFDGLIAIKGFTRNAIVHITDAAGNTVYATRANGGQAIWDGRTHEGKSVASGVYYVFASAEDGSMRSATKILIVR